MEVNVKSLLINFADDAKIDDMENNEEDRVVKQSNLDRLVR